MSFQTRSNNNLAVNHRDPNYFASSSLDSPAVMIWDRRATSRHTSSKTYTDVIDSEDMPWGCALKLDRVIDPTYESNIRNLRYSRDESGLLGVLSASGELQLIQTGKEHYEHNPEDDVEGSPELVQVKKSHEVAFPYFSEDFSYPADNRIVSFDWVPIGSSYHQPRMIIRRANNDIDILLKPSSNQNLVMDLLDFSSRANRTSQNLVAK